MSASPHAELLTHYAGSLSAEQKYALIIAFLIAPQDITYDKLRDSVRGESISDWINFSKMVQVDKGSGASNSGQTGMNLSSASSTVISIYIAN
jgi:hypothetical protein